MSFVKRWVGFAVSILCVFGGASLVSAQADACPTTAPTGAPALLAAAEACLEPSGRLYERDAERALVYALDAAAARPASPEELARAYDVQAQAHFWLGQWGQAIARQTQALLLLPTAERYALRAELMGLVGDTAGAIADAEQAITLEPRQLDLYLWLGRYALENADYDLALDVLERAAAFSPDDAEVALLLGDVHYARVDYARAQAAYQRYMALADSVSPVVVARLSVIERQLSS
jgi:tetratricopeptide (TPR) repeat protein